MKKEKVVLLHGLGETKFTMSALERFLGYGRYETESVQYPSTDYSVEYLAEQYLGRIFSISEGGEKLHFVVHSMGCQMLRYYLQQHPSANNKVGRIVMLAPTNDGTPVFGLYKHNPLLKYLLGPAMAQGAPDEDCLPLKLSKVIVPETGIIAACIPLDPFSLFCTPWPHDGRTSVEGTKLEGMKDHIILPTSHELMVFNPVVIYQTYHFLRYGKFSKSVFADTNFYSPSKEVVKDQKVLADSLSIHSLAATTHCRLG